MKKQPALLGICCCLLLTGCSTPAKNLADTVQKAAENISKATDTPAPSDTPEPESEPKALSLGTKATLGDWKFCVKKAEIKKTIKNGKYRYFKPGKGKRFLCITMTARNYGHKAATLFPRVGYADKMFTAVLYYKEKYEYQPTQLLAFDKDLMCKSISPLTTQSGILTFEIPKKTADSKKDFSLRIGTSTDYLTYSLKTNGRKRL